jgi:hypothetical protein
MSTGTGQTEQWLGHAVFLVQPNVQTTTSNVVSSFGEQLSVSRRYTPPVLTKPAVTGIPFS